MNYSPKKTKSNLQKHNFSFKKKYGQNFIIDKNIINAIVNKSNIEENSLVIEIGPGSGALTEILATRAKNIICYEIDETLKPILSSNLKEHKNIKIIYGDFLKRNVNEDIKNIEYKNIYVIANLPYYITTPIILKIIEDDIKVDKMVVMVQKEVGNRFNAKPGTKDYNSLTIYMNYYFEMKKLMDVSRNVFMPKPNVDSVIIELKRRETFLNVTDKPFFFKLIRNSFQQRRKTIRNNLKNYDLNKIEKILLKHGFDLNVRAEMLPIEIFVELSNEMSG